MTNAIDNIKDAVIVFIKPTLYQRAVGVAIGIGLIILTIYLLRKFQMKEEHGLPWLIGGVVLILLSLSMQLLKIVTYAIGAGTPVIVLFTGCILFLIALNLSFSLTLSRQKKQIHDLTIELALQNSTGPRQGRRASRRSGLSTTK